MKKKLLTGLMTASLALGSLLFSPTASADIQTYEGKGEYIMSDYETPVVAKERAKARAMANAQCSRIGGRVPLIVFQDEQSPIDERRDHYGHEQHCRCA
ncbi:MAG: hypothetical protein IJU71_12490 [Selenomonadaceae bacterium]|nr:hypothetical protein [Selenomonadaceae bacterium]